MATTEKGPYSRVYWTIADDPQFARVYENRMALGAWLQMLLIADAMWPASAPMPPRNPTVRLLIDCGLVIVKPGNRYSLKGLEAERERRSASGRNAAAMRWQSERNADPMPRRDEQRREEKSNGVAMRPQSFISMPDKSHHGQHPDCLVCHPGEVKPA